MSNVSKILKFLFPEFYNKITWLLVLSGILLCSNPLWETLTNWFIKNFTELEAIEFPSGPLIGLALILVGLGYNILYSYLTNRSLPKITNEEKHDQKIFRKADKQLSEQQLLNLTSRLTSEHAYWYEEINRVDDFIHFFKNSGNSYLSRSLMDESKKLTSELEKLMQLLVTEFEIFPREQTGNFRFHMHPRGNCDLSITVKTEDATTYREIREKLYESVSSVKEAYNVYRLAVKSKLYV